MNCNISQSKPQDLKSIVAVVKESFKTAQHTDGNEHHLVQKLHHSKNFIPKLSLKAEIDHNIVGYVLFSQVFIENKNTTPTQSLALAPVAVLPQYQNQGIGKKLIESGHKIAKDLGYTSSIVLGDPNYYHKFGYKTSTHYKIESPFDVAEEFFMVKELVAGGLKNVFGVVVYGEEFLGG